MGAAGCGLILIEYGSEPVPAECSNSSMPLRISPKGCARVLAWPPAPELCICPFGMAAFFCKYRRRPVLTVLLWVLLAVVGWSVYLTWIVVTRSINPI